MNRSSPPRCGHFSFLIPAFLIPALLTTSAFALDESEVQSAIAASSSEQVSGNVFIWFLCAVAFLKISQKIDSFMTSLGINVGRTGGSMLGELLIAGRALGLAAKTTGSAVGNIFNRGSTVNNAASPPAGQAFTGTGGGMIGSISRAAGNAAAANATGTAKGVRNSIGGAMFDNSLKHDGQFSKNVIGAVATGSISAVGSITGPRAAQALTSYLGYESQNSGGSGENDMSVEDGVPVSGEREPTSDTGIPVAGQTPPGRSTSVPVSGSGAPASTQSPTQVSESAPIPGGAPVSTADAGSVADEPPSEFPGVSSSVPEDVITPDGGAAAAATGGGAVPYPGSPASNGSASPGQQADSPMTGASGGTSVPGQPAVTPMPEASEASDEPPSDFSGVPYSGSTPPEDTVTLDGGSAGPYDTPSSQAEPTVQSHQPVVTDGRNVSGDQAAPSGDVQSGSIPQSPPTFRNVEIGGSRITGYETPAGGGKERQFAMYNASQYMEPSGPYETVKTTDGESWYKQYAQPTVQKTPKEVSPGKIRYDEKIVQTMPQIPKRKDRV